jgi:hypothetical protein
VLITFALFPQPLCFGQGERLLAYSVISWHNGITPKVRTPGLAIPANGFSAAPGVTLGQHWLLLVLRIPIFPLPYIPLRFGLNHAAHKRADRHPGFIRFPL